jgi:hypothetical protein
MFAAAVMVLVVCVVRLIHPRVLAVVLLLVLVLTLLPGATAIILFVPVVRFRGVVRLVCSSIVLSLLLLLATPCLCRSALLLSQSQPLLQIVAPLLPCIPVWVTVICVLLFGLRFRL